MNDRLKVFGLGNPYVRDDAIGLELVRLLSGVLPAVITFREMPFPNISLLNEFVEGTPVVFIDAIRDDKPVGSVTLSNWGDEVSHSKAPDLTSPRSLSVLNVLDSAKEFGHVPPPIYFIGISVKDTGPGEGLSAELSRQLPSVLSRVCRIIESLLSELAYA